MSIAYMMVSTVKMNDSILKLVTEDYLGNVHGNSSFHNKQVAISNEVKSLLGIHYQTIITNIINLIHETYGYSSYHTQIISYRNKLFVAKEKDGIIMFAL